MSQSYKMLNGRSVENTPLSRNLLKEVSSKKSRDELSMQEVLNYMKLLFIALTPVAFGLCGMALPTITGKYSDKMIMFSVIVTIVLALLLFIVVQRFTSDNIIALDLTKFAATNEGKLKQCGEQIAKLLLEEDEVIESIEVCTEKNDSDAPNNEIVIFVYFSKRGHVDHLKINLAFDKPNEAKELKVREYKKTKTFLEAMT